MKKKFWLLMIFALVVLAGCADSVDVQKCLPEEPYGFWSGLWHGWTSFFSFFGSLFSDDIAVYAVNNNGGWYDFGFVLGAGILGGTVSKTTSRR
jgi:hypothetical protein